MTIKEAFELARSGRMYGGRYEDFLAVVIPALEKQIPKKPAYRLTRSHYKVHDCPNCGQHFGFRNDVNYCENCGQKIDWSEI